LADIIVAGNTSGSITISAPLVAGSGTLTLPTGTDTLIGKATTDTLTNKTLGAGTVFPAGAVLQVVSSTYGTQVTLGAVTLTDTGLTASITPKFSTSKILVIVSQNGVGQAGASNINLTLKLLRNSTSLINFENTIAFTGGATNLRCASSTNYLDSPATTSATTYKTQFANNAGTGSAYVQAGSETSTITLMEIAV